MNEDYKKSYNTIFLLSFIVIVLKLGYMSSHMVLPLLLRDYTIVEYTVIRKITDLIGITLSASIILAGYWFGKKSDMSQYRDYIRRMAYSWILVELIAVGGWFLTDDFLKSIFEIAMMNGVRGYEYLAPLFSGITVGWLVEDRFKIKTVWSKTILRYVLIFQGAVIVQSLFRVYFTKTMLLNRQIAMYEVYTRNLSYALIPVSLWFLWKMYKTGTQVELGTEYGCILFTLWVPRVAVELIHLLVETVLIDHMNATELLVLMFEDTLSTSIGVFGNAFAILCFGYIHSKYKFAE